VQPDGRKEMAASVFPPSGIRMPCTRIIIPSNTSSAFLLSRSHFLSMNLPIHPRTPTCPCANPTRKIPDRSDACRSSTNKPGSTDPQMNCPTVNGGLPRNAIQVADQEDRSRSSGSIDRRSVSL
jgi:hypothetical protein